jgi:hypothetical protein
MSTAGKAPKGRILMGGFSTAYLSFYNLSNANYHNTTKGVPELRRTESVSTRETIT